ncbi:hypothetical protein HPB52_019040 [Rhipicephalus sanguineus]|uniref:Uncharacterized protein n=1 Tax=Rhipicephalus sanguineus TaxID=34632 RepID=A0A9D4TBE3_RHISA|nr:hypothetical protein HPB52_019040 [Rhipicephalus sanguineus]
MITDASTGIKIRRLVDGRAFNFSEESPSHKEPSSMSLDASRDEAEDDVPYVSSVVAIEDILADNSDAVAKSRNKAEKLVRCELLVDKGCKDETASMSIILQVMQCGTLASAEHSLGVLACKSRFILRDKPPCLLTKAPNSDTGGVAHPRSCMLLEARRGHGIDVSLVVGADATNDMKIHRLLCCSASISSEQSPSLKEFSSLSLDASRVEAQNDVSCASSELSIEDALPNLDVEAKPRNKVDKLVLCDLVVDKGSQEATACHCRTSHASTPQRAQCHMAALWSAGRPQTVSTTEPSKCRLQPGMSIILQVVECGGLASAEHNPGALCCKPQLHQQDKLLRVFTKVDMDSDTGGAEFQAAAFGGYASLLPPSETSTRVAHAQNTVLPGPVAAAFSSSFALRPAAFCVTGCHGCCGIAVPHSTSAKSASGASAATFN